MTSVGELGNYRDIAIDELEVLARRGNLSPDEQSQVVAELTRRITNELLVGKRMPLVEPPAVLTGRLPASDGSSTQPQSAASQTAPGWYPSPVDPMTLEYHDGSRWTGHRAANQSVRPGWYLSPTDPSMLQYHDGINWTTHLSPNRTAPTIKPGWYPAPDRRGAHRYHDGTRWTEHYDR